jgi:hypothetical protein
VAVAFFVVINAVWVLPHFGDWSTTRAAMNDARRKEEMFTDGISHKNEIERVIAKYQNQNQVVPPEDQAVQFYKTIVNQSQASGVGILNTGGGARQSLNTNNPYFVEQNQTIQTQSGEKQLVDFLYSIGADPNSLIRVKVLSVQPDPPHQQLTARITLVASYQRKLPGAGAPAAPKAPTTQTAAAPKPGTVAPKPPATVPPGTVPPGAAPRPATANPAGTPRPPMLPPMNHPPATNKLSPLTPNKK